MGKTNGPYRAEFPVGTTVRIAPESTLKEFMRPAWKLHNPVQAWQLPYGGTTAVVETVHYYHGGDELYVLRGIANEGIKGVWHEACLEAG